MTYEGDHVPTSFLRLPPQKWHCDVPGGLLWLRGGEMEMLCRVGRVGRTEIQTKLEYDDTIWRSRVKETLTCTAFLYM